MFLHRPPPITEIPQLGSCPEPSHLSQSHRWLHHWPKMTRLVRRGSGCPRQAPQVRAGASAAHDAEPVGSLPGTSEHQGGSGGAGPVLLFRAVLTHPPISISAMAAPQAPILSRGPSTASSSCLCEGKLSALSPKSQISTQHGLYLLPNSV